MDETRPPLTVDEVEERANEAQDWANNLDQDDPTYDSKKMVGESRLENLAKWNLDPGRWDKENRETEENLRSAQQVNQFLPLAKEGKEEEDSRVRRPHSSHGRPSYPTGFAPYAGSSINPFGGHFASDGVMAGQGRPAHAMTWDFDTEGMTGPVIPGFSNSIGRPSSTSESSVDSAFSKSRKRQRDSLHSNGDFSRPATKVARSTVSPASTVANTPSSYDSNGHTETIPEDFFGLFGGDPNEDTYDFIKSKKEQEEHMKAMQSRREQELADEAFAKSLQEEFNNGVPSSPQPPRAGPSNIAASQTYFDLDGQIRRPTKMSSPSIKDELFAQQPMPRGSQSSHRPMNSYNIKDEGNPFLPCSSRSVVKNDPFPVPNNWDEFVTISSDDEPEKRNPATGAHPNSDLVEIDAQSWGQSNGRGLSGTLQPGNTMPGASNSNLGAMSNLDALLSSAANGVSNTFGGAMSSLGDLIGLGGSSVYGNPLFNTSGGFPVIDLENDSYNSTGNMYQQNVARAGLNPMDTELVNRYRERYDYIAHDPTKTAKEMKELLENIRPDEDLPPENREGTPAAMMYPLMEHQKLGVAWMKRMEEGTNRGGSKYFYLLHQLATNLRLSPCG